MLRTLTLGLLLLISAGSAARADLITTFTLNDVVFPSSPVEQNLPAINSTLIGSFTYDVDTGAIRSWNMHLVPPFEPYYTPGVFETGVCVGKSEFFLPPTPFPYATGGDSFNFVSGGNCGVLLILEIAAPTLNGTAALTGGTLFGLDEDAIFNRPISGALIAVTPVPELGSLVILFGIAAATSAFWRGHIRRYQD